MKRNLVGFLTIMSFLITLMCIIDSAQVRAQSIQEGDATQAAAPAEVPAAPAEQPAVSAPLISTLPEPPAVPVAPSDAAAPAATPVPEQPVVAEQVVTPAVEQPTTPTAESKPAESSPEVVETSGDAISKMAQDIGDLVAKQVSDKITEAIKAKTVERIKEFIKTEVDNAVKALEQMKNAGEQGMSQVNPSLAEESSTPAITTVESQAPTAQQASIEQVPVVQPELMQQADNKETPIQEQSAETAPAIGVL